MKLLFFDVETTGLDPKTCAIHQLAGMVVMGGQVKETFNLKIKPHEGAEVNDDAMVVSGLSRAIISLHPASATQWQAFQGMLRRYVDPYNKADKFYLVGFNSRAFDEPFLRAWWGRHDKYYGSYFWQVGFDLIVLAAERLKHRLPNMPNFQLATVAKEMGVAVDEKRLHDAMYDVELTLAIYQKLQNPIDATQLAKKVLATLDQQGRAKHAESTGSALKGYARDEARKLESELKELCFEIIKPDVQQQSLF